MKKSGLTNTGPITAGALLSMVLLSLLIMSGCSEGPGVGPNIIDQPGAQLEPGSYKEARFDPKEQVETLQFASADDFKAFVISHASSGYSYAYYGARTEVIALDSAGGGASMPAPEQAAKAVATPSANDFSQTNNQVAGVDEADIIKTDGDYIYTISGSRVYIIKAYPGEDADVVATIEYKNMPTSLFVSGNHLAVFGDFNDLDFFRRMDLRLRSGMTFFNIYDISNRAEPKLVKEYKFEGNYFNARMTGDFVYFVVSSQPEYRPVLPTPIIVEGAAKRAVPLPDVYYYNIPYRNMQFITVHALNIAQPSGDVNSKTIAVEASQNLYMSEKNIYVTYTESVNEYDLQREIMKELLDSQIIDSDRAVIEKIKAADNDILSQYEKEEKIMQIYFSYLNYMDSEERGGLEDKAEELLKKRLEEYEHLEFTVINKLSVEDGSVEVGGNGKVPGQIINQFSLDENDDVLRIATTISARWSRFSKERTESVNSIYALDSSMKVIGELSGLAEGESIYSTRFIGDKLYMVTFRQVDPFFVIDLSDPRAIKELGQLKIPGFSRYLHPYDDHTIIGIGQDAAETGRTKGLKISLFDVSDFENPREIAKFVTGERYAQSTALYEHKAFLFSREKDLMVIPAYSYEYRDGSREGYNGAFVFKITRDEIRLRGLIDHSKDEVRYGPAVERSLYIEELLYTKSMSLVRINRISDLGSVKNISLESKGIGIPVY